MSFIKVIHESEATGELKEAYQRTLARLSPSVRQRRGDKLPPIVRIFSLCATSCRPSYEFSASVRRCSKRGSVSTRAFTVPAIPA